MPRGESAALHPSPLHRGGGERDHGGPDGKGSLETTLKDGLKTCYISIRASRNIQPALSCVRVHLQNLTPSGNIRGELIATPNFLYLKIGAHVT